ncbi:carbon-nitrogen hydrolase family protein [Kamptonema cortianum]|nr:carbon-nitrogen hydrolase family protein [Geitlerinema splendidum]MDK3158486.1 carbon-nitrogen hydrolase family protein [Kamptonema cortianum]
MRIACAQSDVTFNDPHANLLRAENWIADAKDKKADLVVFPEAFLTGYCVSNLEDAESIAIRAHCDSDFEITDCDPSIARLQALAIDNDLHIVAGFCGKDDFGLYNGAVLCEPSGRMRRYVKTHLPYLGFDNFASPGSALPVFQTELGLIGILICYDLRPPEAARVLALKGAELIVLPTNWPTRDGVPPHIVCPARASENRVNFATCNRVGKENGFEFRGQSAVYRFDGHEIVSAGDQECLIVTDIDMESPRNKRSVIIEGKFELDAFAVRQPTLYREITE